MTKPRPFAFNLEVSSGRARTGVMHTPHGNVLTPAFMPVASQASVKAITPHEARQLGTTILLANTYHLYLRPGIDTITHLGGLHSFMGWDGPILTDSGGFQAFSLGDLRQVNDDGILFRSHLDGSQHLFTPEASIRYQEALGADLITCLDQCIPFSSDEKETQEAMERTHRWAQRCLNAHHTQGQALFGIVQGGHLPELRKESVETIVKIGFDGYAIGGLSVGEPKALTYDLTATTADLLPQDKPRYLMGVGSPEDLVECVYRGIDLFDCALPTRVARNAGVFTRRGRVDITGQGFKEMASPIDKSCDCYTCLNFTAGYINHLFKAAELLAYRLATIHNLRFVQRLMEEMRQAIIESRFPQYRETFLKEYHPADGETRLIQKEKWLSNRRKRYLEEAL